jgi:hypothetical protein
MFGIVKKDKDGTQVHIERSGKYTRASRTGMGLTKLHTRVADETFTD